MIKMADFIKKYTLKVMPDGWSRISNPQNYIVQFKQFFISVVASYIVTAIIFLTYNPFLILGLLLDKFSKTTENYSSSFPSIFHGNHQELLAVVILFSFGELLLLIHACLDSKTGTGTVISFIKQILLGTSNKISNIIEFILTLGLAISIYQEKYPASIYTILIIIFLMFIKIILTGQPKTTI